jgi:hypothetical protein
MWRRKSVPGRVVRRVQTESSLLSFPKIPSGRVFKHLRARFREEESQSLVQ